MAVAALAAPIAACGSPADTWPGLAPVLAGLALAAAGAGCWIGGRRWNRGSVRHSLYFVPLQYWGLAYVVLVVLFAAAGVGVMLRPGT